MKISWKALAPVVVAIVIAVIPAPAGLAQHAWYFFAIFAGVIVGLMLEPIPGAAIGLIAMTLVMVLAPFTPSNTTRSGGTIRSRGSPRWSRSPTVSTRPASSSGSPTPSRPT